MRLSLHEIYKPIEGVKYDFEKLLESFTQTESVRYEQFAECWTKKKMSFILTGRPDYYEAREFTEECLKLALTFALKPYVFQVRIGGLYLMYGLYIKQLCEPTIQIRITLSQWKELQEFMAEVETQEHFDVEYIFNFLRFHKAFMFVATSSQVDALAKEPIEKMQRQRHDSFLDQKGSVSELLEPDNISQLAAIHEKYHQMKCALAGKNKKHPEKSMDMLNTDLVQYVTKSVATHEEWRKSAAMGLGKRVARKRLESGATTTSESEPDSDYESAVHKKSSRKSTASRASRMADIRSKAFTNTATASKSRRYRQVVTESDKDKSSESPKKGKKSTSQQDMSESDSVMSPPETIPNVVQTVQPALLDMPVFSTEEVITKGKGKGKGKKSGKSPNKPKT